MVLEAGIEPACSDERQILSLLCLPIPPLKHDNNIALSLFVVKDFIKKNAPKKGAIYLSSTMTTMPRMAWGRRWSFSTLNPTNMCARVTVQHVAIHILNTPSATNPDTVSSVIAWCPNPSLNLVVRHLNVRLRGMSVYNTPRKKRSKQSGGNK
jgi:hypothetical protein